MDSHRLSAAVTLLLVVGLLVGSGGLVARAIELAPKGWRLEGIRLTPPESGTVTALSWRELGQAPGVGVPNTHRLLVAHEEDGGWRLANGAHERTVYVLTADGRYRDLDAVAVARGDTLETPAGRLDLTAATRHDTRLEGGAGWSLRWSGDRLDHGGRLALGRCRIESPRGSLGAGLDAIREALRPVGRALFESRWPRPLFTVGGRVDCPERRSLEPLAPGSLGFFAHGDQLLVRQDAVEGRFRLRRSDGRVEDLAQPWTAVDPGGGRRVVAVYLGAVRYDILTEGSALLLKPTRNRGLFDQPFADRPGISFDWEASENGRWLGAAPGEPLHFLWPGVGGSLGLAAAILGWRICHARLPWRNDVAALPVHAVYGAGAGALAGWGFVMPQAPDLIHPLAVAAAAWGWASVIIAGAGALRGWRAVLWLCATMLACAGILTQLQLAIGMATEQFVDGPRKHALAFIVLAVGSATAGLLPPGLTAAFGATVLGGRAAATPVQGALALALRLGVPGVVLAGLLVQMGRGSAGEAGLGWAQPSEGGKLVFAFGLAWIATWVAFFARLDHPATRWASVAGRLAGGAGVVCLAVPAALLAVNDISPLAILASVFAVWLAVLYGIAGRSRRSLAVLVLGTALGGVAVAAAWTLPETAPAVLGAKVAERFAIREAPFTHPGGTQVAMAYRAIADAPLWPDAEEAFGANGRPIRLLPEVKNDMIAAFLIATWGVVPMAGLVMIQGGFLVAAAALAIGGTRGGGDFEETLTKVFTGVASLVLAATQCVQWAMGYTSALGGLVMGQPFTWFSTGTSHVLAVALPLLVFGLLRDRRPPLRAQGT